MRSIARLAEVSINTVGKLLVDAGVACAAHHEEHVRGVKAKRVQCDEIWSFCYSKQKNVAAAKRKDLAYGDVWTWTALEADSKLLISYMIGGREGDYALALMEDLPQPTVNRGQLTTHRAKGFLEGGDAEVGDGND